MPLPQGSKSGFMSEGGVKVLSGLGCCVNLFCFVNIWESKKKKKKKKKGSNIL